MQHCDFFYEVSRVLPEIHKIMWIFKDLYKILFEKN